VSPVKFFIRRGISKGYCAPGAPPAVNVAPVRVRPSAPKYVGNTDISSGEPGVQELDTNPLCLITFAGLCISRVVAKFDAIPRISVSDSCGNTFLNRYDVFVIDCHLFNLLVDLYYL
jgi:hypothetical protein